MALQNPNRKPGWLEAAFFLGAIVLLMGFSQANAETPPADEGGWASYVPAVKYPIWIQNPWTSESVLTYVEEPNTELWNGQRIKDYEESLTADSAPPLGVLTIRSLDIQAPIYNGTDEFALNRGAGRIRGMAKIDEDGNLGISGHRDGFFRGLKDIKEGDEIEIQTTRGAQSYAVSSITIVPKSDISPLTPTDDKTLTIVTCYPFYFVGNAPKRYIVKATPTDFREHPAEE
jgi:LPXTG-site transpeptidase (sortase) family protein